MKIKSNDVKNSLTLDSLKVGDIFKFNNDIYIKTKLPDNMHFDSRYNTVNFLTLIPVLCINSSNPNEIGLLTFMKREINIIKLIQKNELELEEISYVSLPDSKEPIKKKKYNCNECQDKGYINTGNNDLPCRCDKGRNNLFNVCGEDSPVTGGYLLEKERRQSKKDKNTSIKIKGIEYIMNNELRQSIKDKARLDDKEIDLRITLGKELGLTECTLFTEGWNSVIDFVLINHVILERVLGSNKLNKNMMKRENKNEPFCIGDVEKIPIIYCPSYDNSDFRVAFKYKSSTQNSIMNNNEMDLIQ